MADNRFTQMIKTARDHGVENEQQEHEPEVTAPAPPKTRPMPAPKVTTSRGRPATGKRSDPDYESTTVFLRRDTKKSAAKLLIDDNGQDLSDVLEKLLSSWVRKHS